VVLQQLLETAGVSRDSRIIVYAATSPPTLAAKATLGPGFPNPWTPAPIPE